jgi:hypothetical protein
MQTGASTGGRPTEKQGVGEGVKSVEEAKPAGTTKTKELNINK